MVQQLSTNTFGTARWIVDPTASQGTHTTIAAALTSASSGQTIFIRPGTYTENLTLKAGVNLVAYTADAMQPNVTIVGKATFSTTGTVNLSGLCLQTNSDFVLVNSSTGSVILSNCNIIAANNTAISMSAAGSITLQSCIGNISTTGITFFALTAGVLFFYYCNFSNSGSSVTASTAANASIICGYTIFPFAITVSGTTGAINGSYCQFAPGTDVIALTQNSTSAVEMNLRDCFFFNSGTSSAISIGAGAQLAIINSGIRSSATNVITGSGTLRCSGLEFEASAGYNVTTVVPLSTGLINVNANQPAFLAFPSGNTANATGDSFNFTCLFNTEIFDQNSNFASNTFTAPFTARYQLGASISMSTIAAGHTMGFAQILTSNRTYAIWEVNTAATRDSGAVLVLGGFTQADMDAGDTATVNLNISGSTRTVTYLNSSYFSGSLIT